MPTHFIRYGHAVPQTISRRCLIAEVRIEVQFNPCGIFVRKVTLRQERIRVFGFSSVTIISPTLLIQIFVHDKHKY